MIKQRRYLAIVLVSVVSIAIPSTAEAGPLLDWLFQRNRSQGLANTGLNAAGQYAANPYVANQNSANPYGANPYAAARPIGGAATGRAPCGSCLTNLFGGKRNGLAGASRPGSNAYAAAGQSNVYGNTAGYAPQTQGGCSTGWCQQTVVRWIPQTAYRTAYQSVPVTTYKTSTTINPANGLPRTCTRPCTSYSMQARRVPYTSYRPVYTTVPVADTWGRQQQPSVAPAGSGLGNPAAGYTAAPPIPNYALQPPTSAPVAPGGCSSCQNGASGYAATPPSGYNNWQNVPRYTPGNATNFPPPSAGTPWSNAPLAGPSANSPGATPWRPTTGNYGTPSGSAPWQSQAQDSNLGATDWQPLDRRDGTRAPSQGGTPADLQPRLRPESYPDTYGTSTLRPLDTQPMPERIRRRINSQTKSRFVPRETAKPENSSYLEDERRREEAYVYQQRAAEQRAREIERDRLFRTPQDNAYTPPTDLPISPPSNKSDFGGTGTRNTLRGGIRAQEPTRSWPNLDDKTADRDRPSGEMPIIEETTRTRYAATPIQWAVPKQPPRRETINNDWRNNAERWRQESRRQSDWTPRR